MAQAPGPEDSIESIILEHHDEHDPPFSADANASMTGAGDFYEYGDNDSDTENDGEYDVRYHEPHGLTDHHHQNHQRQRQRQRHTDARKSVVHNAHDAHDGDYNDDEDALSFNASESESESEADFGADFGAGSESNSAAARGKGQRVELHEGHRRDASKRQASGEGRKSLPRTGKSSNLSRSRRRTPALQEHDELELFPRDERVVEFPSDFDDGGFGLIITNARSAQPTIAAAGFSTAKSVAPIAIASLDLQGNVVLVNAAPESTLMRTDDVGAKRSHETSAMRDSVPAGKERSKKKEMEPLTERGKPTAMDADELQDFVEEMFGPDVSINITSKQIQDRIKAITDITTQISDTAYHKPRVFECICRVAQAGLSDSAPKVISSAIKLAEVAVGIVSPHIPYLAVRDGAFLFIHLLVAKTGDNNAKTRELSISTLETLARYPQTLELMGPLLCEVDSSSNWRPIVSRLTILANIIPIVGFQNNMNFEMVMTFTSTALQHANNNVRKAGIAVTLEVYRLAGSKTEQYLRNLNPALLKLLNEELQNEIGNPDIKPLVPQPAQPAPKAEVSTHELEQLSESDMQTATPMFPIFGQGFIVNCFSKTWSTRESAYNSMEAALLAAKGDPRDAFHASCVLLLRGFQDSVPQIFLASLKALDPLLDKYEQVSSFLHVIQSGFESLIPMLVSKAGDSNTRIRDSSIEALFQLSKKRSIGHHLVAKHILQPLESMNAWRAVVGRITILDKMVDEFGFKDSSTKGSFQVENVMGFVISTFQSPNARVRKAAFDITLHIYEVAGRSIESYLKNLKPAIMKELRTAIIQIARKHRNIQSAPQRPLASLVAHLAPEEEFEFCERPATFSAFPSSSEAGDLPQAKPWKAPEPSKPSFAMESNTKQVIRNRMVFS